MLTAEDRVVGVYLAYYSQRHIDGEIHRFCNLASWCVLQEYRSHSLRLLRALLAQEGYHFTDLTPNKDVVQLNTRLKFQHLDTATALILNLPWPPWPGRTRVVSDRSVIQSALGGRDLEIYRDHAHAAAAHHLVVLRGTESCYVMFRRDRRDNLPLFASMLHVGNLGLFRHTAQYVFRHLLIHHGIPATLAELRVIGYRPRLSVMLRSRQPKMYRSNHLGPEQIDYLYSELTCLE
jgi:hypothetical protein